MVLALAPRRGVDVARLIVKWELPSPLRTLRRSLSVPHSRPRRRWCLNPALTAPGRRRRRSHFVDLMVEAGFLQVAAVSEPFGPRLEAAAAALGVVVPPGAPERASSPALLVTGTWPPQGTGAPRDEG